MPDELFRAVLRHWPWADNPTTRQWCDATWIETDGDKKAIADGLRACEWIDEVFDGR